MLYGTAVGLPQAFSIVILASISMVNPMGIMYVSSGYFGRQIRAASESSAQLPNEVLVLVGMLLITGPVIANSTASCLLCETREPSFEFLESKKGANQSLDSEHSRSQSTQLVHTNNFVHKIIPGFVHTSFLVVIHAVAKCVSEI